jgi:phage gp36-like protein
MIKRRNRTQPELPLQERLHRFAERARAKAENLPPGAERDRLVQKAATNDAAATIDRWLSSPGLQSPK